jgi:hypothetical protein
VYDSGGRKKKVLVVLREFDLTIFEALTAVLLKIQVIMQCQLVNTNSQRYFQGM